MELSMSNIRNDRRIKYTKMVLKESFINLLKYNLCIIPITFTLNFIVTLIFNKGYKSVGQMLPVTIIYIAVGVFSYVIVNYLYFKETPLDVPLKLMSFRFGTIEI